MRFFLMILVIGQASRSHAGPVALDGVSIPFSGVLAGDIAFDGTFDVANESTRNYEPITSYSVDVDQRGLSFSSAADGRGSSGIFPNPFADKAEVLMTASNDRTALSLWFAMPSGTIDFASQLATSPPSAYVDPSSTIRVESGVAGLVAGVPEPSTLVLGIIAGGVVCAVRSVARLAGAA